MYKIKVEENQIRLEAIIPFKGSIPVRADHSLDIIQAFDLVLIDALTKRAEACTAMLSRNMDRVVFSNENIIAFKKANGSEHHFNIPSYENILKGIELLQQKRYKLFSCNEPVLRQCQKALYWVDKPEDVGIYSFGNLITCLEALVSRCQSMESK